MNESNIDTTLIDKERLEDFKKVLTFQLVSKIKYHFKGSVKLFFSAPKIWAKFRAHSLSDTTINPYALITKFNDAGLSRNQVKAIFGKYPGCKSFTIPYSELIAQCADITIREHGSLQVKDKKYGVSKCYMLPFEFLNAIFEDAELLEKACDAKSDYYTNRQRRLIFTQLLDVKKNYHYKTNAEISDEDKIAELIKEI